MTRRCHLLLIWLLPLLAGLGVIVSQCDAQGMDALTRKRLIYRFDFEERQRGNYEDLPMHWFAIGSQAGVADPNFARQPLHAELMSRNGYPGHSPLRLEERNATSGKYSLYMGLNGGNVGAFLEIGTLPTIPQSDYLVTASVRTQSLKYAGAHLRAYFVDGAGKRVEASVADTGPIINNNGWQNVSIRLLGDHPGAIWVVIELCVQQPMHTEDSILGKHQIVYEDVTGGAWFDDVTLWQLPRVSVETQSPVNIIRVPDRPKLMMNVRDLTGQPLSAMATVYDSNLNEIAKIEQPVGGGAPSSIRWMPTLPKFGWYLVDLIVRDPSAHTRDSEMLPIARTLGAFLWLGEEGALDSVEGSRFTLDAQNVTDDQLELLPLLMDQSGLDAMVVSCWAKNTTRSNLDDRTARLESLIQQVLSRGRRMTISLDPVPDELALAADVDRHSPLAMFGPGRNAWMPYLGPILMRQGQRTRRWQLGSVRDAGALATGDLSSLVASVSAEFQALMPQPSLVLPWRLDMTRPRGLSDIDMYVLDVSPGVVARDIPQHTVEWRGDAKTPALPFSLYLREPPATAMTHPRRMADLAMRMLSSWEAQAQGVVIPKPWTYATDRHTVLLPDPLLGVFASVSRRLAGRKFLGYMPMPGGAECMIFSGSGGGMLAAWNRSGTPQEAELNMYLGPAPRAIDIMGNRTELPLINGKHHFELTSTPTFFEGIDPALAQFRAAFKVSPTFIESLQVPHERQITLFNPWNRTISGTLFVLQPEDWNIQPRRTFFSIAAGQTSQLPVSMTFPVSEIAGKKRMIVRLDFVAEQRYTIDISADLTLGLKDIDFDAQVTLERDPKSPYPDVVVTQLITNTGNKTVSLYASATLMGFPRDEKIVAGLMPGQSTYRRFRFSSVNDKARQGTIRVALREPSGPAMLNKVIPIDQE